MNKIDSCKKREKETVAFLEKQIALMTIAIEKTETMLDDMKKERKKYLQTYEQIREMDGKSKEVKKS
jgi:nicotinic acid mononucleotide adenylyltransferase